MFLETCLFFSAFGVSVPCSITRVFRISLWEPYHFFGVRNSGSSYVCAVYRPFERVKGFSPPSCKAPSGVPQDALGSRLFPTFANGVHNASTDYPFLRYAGDIQIFREIRKVGDSKRFQTDIQALGNCCSRNELRFNQPNTNDQPMPYTHKSDTVAFSYNINFPE